MRKIDVVSYTKIAFCMWIMYLVLFLIWNISKIIPFNLIFSIIGWFMATSIIVSIVVVIIIQLIHGRGWKGVADSTHVIGLLLLVVVFLIIIVIIAPFWQFVAIKFNEAYEQKIAHS